jgi:hypothetical protein
VHVQEDVPCRAPTPLSQPSKGSFIGPESIIVPINAEQVENPLVLLHSMANVS